MRILEPARRDAMFAIYAFCRAVDDIADDEGDRDERRKALNHWREDLDALYAGQIRPSNAFLAGAVRRFKLDRADFEAVIDGMQMDVDEDICAPNWEKLDLYCDRVASAVGTSVCARFWPHRGKGGPAATRTKAFSPSLGPRTAIDKYLT